MSDKSQPQPSPTQPTQGSVIVPQDVFNGVVETLSQLPWVKVAPLMSRLSQIAQQQKQDGS